MGKEQKKKVKRKRDGRIFECPTQEVFEQFLSFRDPEGNLKFEEVKEKQAQGARE
ncbi:MAG: hypothetical protein K9L57_07410 [Spirochaetaceae bacterium]|nr:hypothetical protein [Spirochaetaceae bacterium]